MRVLVAEDEPTYCALVEAILTASGYEVVVARDGQEAWEVLNSGDAPPLAVIDWMMPRMDGIELCRRVKGSSLRHIYVILLTGRNQEEDAVTGREAGADDFFPKPLDPTKLIARVDAGRNAVEAGRCTPGTDSK